jgi:hypothetical protein
MKKWVKKIVFFFLVIFFICVISPVSAFTVTDISVNPSEYLPAGTPVTVTMNIGFPPSGGETFHSTNELQMSTDLENPQWGYNLILDGVEIENPQPTKMRSEISLSGFLLSKPATMHENLRVTLYGNIPSNPTAGQNLVKIQEIDSNNNVVGSVTNRAMPVSSISSTIPTPTSIPAKTSAPSVGSIIVSPIQTAPIGFELVLIAVGFGGLFLALRR